MNYLLIRQVIKKYKMTYALAEFNVRKSKGKNMKDIENWFNEGK